MAFAYVGILTSLIAEIGWNHMGDLELAEKMIIAAKQAGANYAKFQTWQLDKLKSGPWDNDGRRDIYESAQLTDAKHKHLIEACAQNSISFLSSAFSVEDAKYLRELGQTAIKIPSFEIANIDLLMFIADNFKTIFASVGTATEEEILKAKQVLPDETIFMHCVSSYPCEYDLINLPRIEKLKKIGLNVGFSDHTSGIYSSVLALKYNLMAIEKHFTTDHELPGRDNKFAILPEEMKELSKFISLQTSVNTDHGLSYQKCEQEARDVYRGRFNG